MDDLITQAATLQYKPMFMAPAQNKPSWKPEFDGFNFRLLCINNINFEDQR